MFILKIVKVLCFEASLKVLLLKALWRLLFSGPTAAGDEPAGERKASEDRRRFGIGRANERSVVQQE
jgi:hypothetical protein